MGPIVHPCIVFFNNSKFQMKIILVRTPLPLKNTIIYHYNTLILFINDVSTRLKDIEDSQRWLNLEKDESTYKRDLAKRIELINWVLENMKNPNLQICELMESRLL